jgi:hypothetical protein
MGSLRLIFLRYSEYKKLHDNSTRFKIASSHVYLDQRSLKKNKQQSTTFVGLTL